jgi:hypothetical protein
MQDEPNCFHHSVGIPANYDMDDGGAAIVSLILDANCAHIPSDLFPQPRVSITNGGFWINYRDNSEEAIR